MRNNFIEKDNTIDSKFKNVEQIVSVNTDLLKDLECIEKWAKTERKVSDNKQMSREFSRQMSKFNQKAIKT